LEQAEQQFRAAALIDFVSRALNLFYGLSQAGRAIAAASAALPNGGWRLNGHGLKLPGLYAVKPDLASIVVKSDRKVAAMRHYLSRYPALADFIVTTPTGGAQGWPMPNMGLALRWAKPDDVTTGHVLDGRLTTYRGSKLAYPTLEGATQTVHPLMAWWMVLFSLSMLTRYQPDVWTQMIDVNRSPQATAIEHVLETALEAVPDLINEAIDRVQRT